MKKYLLSILMAFCMVLCLVPMAAFADDAPASSMQTIKIDVGGGNTDGSPYYKIEADSIKLLARDVIYELTGTTDKKIIIWGRNSENDAGEATYIRANNVVVNGGIDGYNNVKLVLEVPEGTDNTIAKVYAQDLKIYGAGTLRSTNLGVTQSTGFLPSALHITDTKVVVNCPANRSGEWNGVCVLDGNADVTYTACGDYAPLQIGVKLGDTTHKVTMMDNAKLRCLHAEPETQSAYSVSGLEIYNGANLTMSGNSYLEVQGRPTTGKYAGYGLFSEANVSVTDKAAIKATGYDVALCVDGNLAISGGNVEAKSAYSNGIFAGGELKISDGAKVNASGYYPALFGNGSVSIESGSQVEATSTADAGIFSRGDVSIKNSTVKVSEAENYYAVTANGTTRVTGSWVETNYEDSINGSISDSVLFNGNSGTVIGNATLLGDTTLEEGKTLVIPEGTSLSVGTGNTFTNNGTVTVEGGFSTVGGMLVCNHHSGGTATCTAQAVCDVCQISYGDLNPANHTALQHVAAKAATTEAEGNIEYWYCADCGKYYRDAAAAKEITRAQTVTAKLMPESTATPTPAPTAAPTTAPTAAPTTAPTAAPTTAPTAAPAAAPAQTAAATATPKPTAAPTAAPTPTATPQVTAAIPQTGDTGSVTLLLALLLLSGGACLGMAVSKKVKQ